MELDNNNDDSNKSKSTLKRGRKKGISPDNIMFKILQKKKITVNQIATLFPR